MAVAYEEKLLEKNSRYKPEPACVEYHNKKCYGFKM
jgi:hypothetical protein